MTEGAEVPERVKAFYVAAAREEDQAFVSSLLRTRSHRGREALAQVAAVGMHASILDVAACTYLEDGADTLESRHFARNLDAGAAADYAFVLALQQRDGRDQKVARGIFEAIRDVHGVQSLSPRHAGVFLQLALKARDFSIAEALLKTAPLRSETRRLGATDLVNPWLRPGQDEQVWLSRLNEHLYGHRFVQVTLRPDGVSVLDRLKGASLKAVRNPARISVIMSCFNPGRHLVTAVRSVLEQTWQNIELLVVDDASPAPACGVLSEVEDLDPRVRVIRKAVNGGTYRARNTALRIATGAFFTCVDSDDWIHPQFLEVGVQPLLSDATLIATRGSGIRVTPDLELGRVGYEGAQSAASSLMVRTFPALNRIGFFDSIRRAADAEYARRIEAAFGGAIVNLTRRPLTLLRSNENSLSAPDFSPGWRHPARQEYAEAQQHFHEGITKGRHAAFVSPHGPRRFPAPRRWERYPEDGTSGGPLDVCVVADWREGCLKPQTIKYLERVVFQNFRVGIVHIESLHDSRFHSEPVAPGVRDLIAAGTVEVLYLDDRRKVRNLVAADPRPLQFGAAVSAHLKVESLNVIADPTAEVAGHYCAATVEENLTTIFGITPAWGAPALPAPVTVKGASGLARTLITVLADGSCKAGDAAALAWPLREPADGERGARLSAVGALETDLEVDGIGALMDAWRLGPAEWARAAAHWLVAYPTVWCLVVVSSSVTYLVSNAGVDVAVADSPTGSAGSYVLVRGDVGPQLTSRSTGGVDCHSIKIDSRPAADRPLGSQ